MKELELLESESDRIDLLLTMVECELDDDELKEALKGYHTKICRIIQNKGENK